jgi:homoserine dehydrogenase
MFGRVLRSAVSALRIAPKNAFLRHDKEKFRQPFMKNPLRVGLVGLGTVGCSVVSILQTQTDLLRKICDHPIQIIAVSARDRTRHRHADVSAYTWHDDPLALARDPRVDVVVEMVGGQNGIALDVCQTALANGKSVVTANKAMMAHHGVALAMQAETKGLSLCYEAAVAGGIPILKMLREGSSANTIESLYGILNGTCNYILTTMAKTGASFEDVLEEAKRLGYAEADPSFDIDGIDTAQKLALLSSMAYGVVPDVNNLYVEGIRGLSAADVAAAEDIGYVIKLIAKARYHRGILHQAVYPALIPNHIPLAHVDDVFNGVLFKGDFLGEIMVTGRGAGGDPTASAIMADLIDLANHRHVYPFKVSVRDLIQAKPESMDTYTCRYYVRFMLRDVAGAVSHVARILADHGVSIRSLKQPEAEYHQGIVPLILTTHECQESVIQKTLSEIRALDILCDDPKLLRVEPF